METAPRFVSAEPVWAKELLGVWNAAIVVETGLRAPPAGGRVTLRVAAMSNYRATVCGAGTVGAAGTAETAEKVGGPGAAGEFVAFGPARAAHGHARVDEIDLTPHLRPGVNRLRIEVVAHHVADYSHANDPGFLQAEVVTASGEVLFRTAPGVPAGTWGAYDTHTRRYAFQRGFSEVYHVGMTDAPVTLVAVSPRVLLPRRTTLPAFEVTAFTTLTSSGTRTTAAADVPEPRYGWERANPAHFKQHSFDSLPGNPHREVALATCIITDGTPRPLGLPLTLTPDGFCVFSLPGELSGFVELHVRARGPAVLAASFDELLTDRTPEGGGRVDARRMDCVNTLAWHLPPGEHRVSCFEPYSLMHLQLQTLSGEVELLSVALRRYEAPDATAAFAHPDAALVEIFEAGRATYAQNAVDFFTDCPSRERAGWLGDSFFTARAALSLTATTAAEHAFLENYLLSPPDPALPDGVLPMCYPADHPNGIFIPQWTLWLILQLEEFATTRKGDPALISAFAPRIDKLLAWFRGYETPEGLLKPMPGWNFIEWSKANEFMAGLNHPTSMLYGGALRAAGRLYARPDWVAHGGTVTRAVSAASFDGEWFVDNAAPAGDSFARTTNRSETCQYYAFYFGAATPASHPRLWQTLLTEFGPDRVARGLHPEIHPANMIWGIMLRLELLRAAGLKTQVLRDLTGYLLPMARTTRTLWEHNNPTASCNHGFASHVCHLLLEELGPSTIR